MSITGETNKREGWIDLLKGVAMVCVLLNHTCVGSLPSIWGKIAGAGSKGVQLFFLLSAYLAFESYGRFARNKKGRDWRWIACKIIALLPLYYIAVILLSLITGGNSYWLGVEGKITPLNILTHFLLINGVFPHYTNSILGTEWYLCVLFAFFLLAPLLYRWINTLRKAFGAWLLTAVLCTGLSLVCAHFGARWEDGYIYEAYFRTFWLIAQFPVLLTGILLYHLLHDKAWNKICEDKAVFPVCLVVSFGLMAVLTAAGESNHVLWSVGFFFLCVSCAIKKNCFRVKGFLQYLGCYSYPIYLFQFLSINAFDKVLSKLNWSDAVKALAELVIVLVCTGVAAWPIERFIDKPIVRAIKNRLQ